MINEEVVLLDSDDEGGPKDSAEDTNVIAVVEDAAGDEGGDIAEIEIAPSDNIDNGDIKTDEAAEDTVDDVVMEYNHKDYADLVGPITPSMEIKSNGSPASSSSHTPAGTPPPSTTPTPSPGVVKPVVTNNQHLTGKFPKRPGAMPPFALFSQEMRSKLQEEEPEIGFGDLGRKLGEMWHALSEPEKEDYRTRARQVADEKMKSWKETVSKMPRHRQLEMEAQKNNSKMKIKKKRTSGYALFCSEYRRKYATEQPTMPFADISKQVAEDWRACSEDIRRSYEMKAQRFNTEEEKRWRQKMYMHQQNQMRMHAQAAKQREDIAKQSYGGMSQNTTYRGRGAGRGIPAQGYRPIQPRGGRGYGASPVSSSGNSSGLVISSVSSLSSTSGGAAAASTSGAVNLPQGISIHRAEPEISLPSSITISRVEPEIQIVEESVQHQQRSRPVAPQTAPHQSMNQNLNRVGTMQGARGRTGVISPGRGRVMMNNRGRASMMGMRSRGPGRPPMGHVNMQGGRMISPRGGMRTPLQAGMSRGRPNVMANGMTMQSRMSSRGMPTMMNRGRTTMAPRMPTMAGQPVSPLKRMVPMGGHSPARAPGMPPLKRARMPTPGYSSSLGYGQNMAGSVGAVNPASLDPIARLCRVCGTPNAVIFRLKDKPEMVGRIDRVLNLKVDVDMDVKAGLPVVICRKCCNLVETFFHYKKSVAEGQISLKKQVADQKEKKEQEARIRREQEERRQAEESRLQREMASRVAEDSIGVDPLDSILPDQSSILPDNMSQPDTKVGTIKIKQESLKTLSSNPPTPMTSVFSDALDVKIKIEPDLLLQQAAEKEKNTESIVESSEKKDEHLKEEEQTASEVVSKDVGEKPVTEKDESTEEDNKEITNKDSSNDMAEESKGDSNEVSTMDISITSVVSEAANSNGEKSVTEALKDISDTIEEATKKLESEAPKSSSKSETSATEEGSPTDLLCLPPGISISRSPVKDVAKDNVKKQEVVNSKSPDKNGENPPDKNEDKSPSKNEDLEKKTGDESKDKVESDMLFDPNEYSDLVDPWNNALEKTGNDPSLNTGSTPGRSDWTLDDKGLEDGPGMEIKDVRTRSDFFYDDDFYSPAGESELGSTEDLIPGSDDPLLEMDEDTVAEDNDDDFGGYDPLNLVQMSDGDLNDLDFEMDDFNGDISLDDNDLLDKDIDNIQDEEKDGPNSDKQDNLDISDESGLDENHKELDDSMDINDGANIEQAGGEEDYHHDKEEDQINSEIIPKTVEKKKETSSNEVVRSLDDSKEDEITLRNVDMHHSTGDKNINDGRKTVENTLDDSKEDDNMMELGDDLHSSSHVVGNFDITEENLNEDCDDDVSHEDHNFESVIDGPSDNFESDAFELGEHESGDNRHNNVLTEDVSSDNFDNNDDFTVVEDDIDPENHRDQVQNSHENSQNEEDTGGVEPGSNCDNSA